MFSKSEQIEKMNTKKDLFEHETLIKALTLLENHLGIPWKTTYEDGNYNVDFIIKNNFLTPPERYIATPIIQKEFQKQHLLKIIERKEFIENHFAENGKKTKIIVIGEKIAPGLKELLKAKGYDYIDGAGNCRIQNDELLINIEGKKTLDFYGGKPNRAFTKTGLKVVFQLLLNGDLLNHPYRTIAKKTKVATGNINNIITGLMEDGFLLRNNAGYKLTNKEDLMQRWITAYGERLKPALEIGKFRFLNPNDFIYWKELPIQKGKTLWGGEAAGNLYTDFLKPQELTLYTTEKRNELIKNYKLVPDPNGNVNVFQKFWDDENQIKDRVPPILTYADLVLEKDNRCMEIALEIYDKYLDENIPST